MRTLEFRLYPTKPQEQQLIAWVELHRRIWNYGLALLQELEQFSAYDKGIKERVPCCPLPWSYRWIKADDESWISFPFSEVRRYRNGGLCCPIRQVHRPPRLNGDSYFSLTSFFAKKNHPNWAELKSCPAQLVRGTLKALGTAWSEYKSGKRDAMGRTRKLFAHKTSTYLLRTYGTLAIEDLKLASMVRRPKPKPAEDGSGTFLLNQAAAKGGLNRSMADAGLGQLRTMLEEKGKERGRNFVRVDPKYTSQRCSVCGHTEAGNRPSQELFCCLKCGHTENADVNAAKNILQSAIE